MRGYLLTIFFFYRYLGHFASTEIKKHIVNLQSKWQNLREVSAQRKHDLEDSLQAQQYFSDAKEVESWIQ